MARDKGRHRRGHGRHEEGETKKKEEEHQHSSKASWTNSQGQTVHRCGCNHEWTER